MHRPAFQNQPRTTLNPSGQTASNRGFSLIEVTLAIGIIAFAFVALFGLLPTGMQTFRASVDATNDITMMQEISAMAQVTRWNKIEDLDFSRSKEIYFYDEEGRRTDTKEHPSDSKEVKARRLYQLKIFVERAYEPGVEIKKADSGKEFTEAKRIVVIIGDYLRPKSKKDFETVKSSLDIVKGLEVRSRTFMIARMESENKNEDN